MYKIVAFIRLPNDRPVQTMLNAVVVTPDPSFADGIQRLALASRKISVYRTFSQYPFDAELDETCRICDPDLLLIDVSQWREALPIITRIRRDFPKTAVLGFGGGAVRLREQECQAAGISVLLAAPVSLDEFQEGVLRAFRITRGSRHPKLTAFLPAKAGNGSSATAFHVSGALAGELRKKVLLVEGDLHSGVLSERAQVPAERGLRDILDDPSTLEDGRWPHSITHKFGIDLLTAGPAAGRTAPKWSNYYHLLQFAENDYDAVVADLPEADTEGAVEVVLRAARICIVCTAERPSLALARRRVEDLQRLAIEPGRVILVVNRWHATDPDPKELGRQVGCEQTVSLPNDYQSLRQATDQGRLVDPETKLGEAYLALARHLLGEGAGTAKSPRKSRFTLGALLGR